MLVLFGITMVSAQDVRYYKLTKKKENGSVSSNVSGGQFITFRGDVCYESNKNGVGVDHGTMQRNDNYSNSQYTIYQRKSGAGSYWGKDATFKFTADKSELNVVLENGDVYVYKYATALAGQETCSLIRKKTSSNQDGGSGGEIVMPPTPIIVNPNNPTPSPIPTPTPTPKPKPNGPKMKDCPICFGSGKCKNCNGNRVRLVLGEYVNCTNCKATGNCPYCHGTGKVVTH